MKVHHLNCGTMCPPFARLIDGKSSFFTRGRMVCHCLLVETNDGLALVDTGLGIGDIEDPKGRLGAPFVAITHPLFLREEAAITQVERLGFKRGDVRHILPTHLDLDHAGGLSDFPDASVHIFHLEHKAALFPQTRKEAERYRPAHFAHNPKWQVHEIGGEKWFGFESVRALSGTQEEVLLIPLIGHTRGHCGIAVKTSTGWLLHAGDAYFAHTEVHQDPPACPAGLSVFQRFAQVDGAARLSNQARLRALVKEHGSEVKVVCAHDPVELEAHLK